MLSGRRFWVVFAAILAVAVVALVATVVLDRRKARVAKVGDHTVTLTKQEQAGRELFANCGSCHRLEASNTNGRVGPSLDLVQPSAAQVRRIISTGAQGSRATMPPGIVEPEDADAIAAYVAKVADREQFFGYRR